MRDYIKNIFKIILSLIGVGVALPTVGICDTEKSISIAEKSVTYGCIGYTANKLYEYFWSSNKEEITVEKTIEYVDESVNPLDSQTEIHCNDL
jgi:20S proteasome alpha/beta subunit